MPKISRKTKKEEEHDPTQREPFSDLSEYEKERLKRIQDNENFLKSLNLLDAKSELQALTKKSQSQARSTVPSRFQKKASPVDQPRRLSLRLRSLQPDGTYQPVKSATQPVPYPERVRPAGPVAAKNELSQDDERPVQLMSVLKGIPCKLENKAEDWNKCYGEEVSKLSLQPNHVVKVTKERIYSLDFHPCPSKLLIAAGDKRGGVGIWDIDAGPGADNLLYRTIHCSPIKSVVFPSNMTSSNVLYSASYDGSIRRLDLTKDTFEEVYVTNQDDDIGISHLSLNSSCQWMLASCNNGQCLQVDERSGSGPVRIWDLHRRQIKTVHVCPVEDNFFVTACVDGSVMMWDMRNLKPKTPKHLQHVYSAQKSVSSAYFSSSGRRLLTTSMDNRLSIFWCVSPGKEMKPTVSMRHDNQTGRWLTNFRAVWDPKNESYFVVGSMARPRQVEVFSVTSTHPLLCLRSEWLTSVCSINAVHPHAHVLAGANSSGRVHVWNQ